MKKIIILGGGFAGVQAAIELVKSKKFEVTLISDRDYLYIYPISIWVPVGIKKFNDVKVSLSKIQKRYPFELIVDAVKSIKSAENKVELENQTLHFDYLIIAFGAEKLQHKGMEHTLSICGKPQMAEKLRDRIDELIQNGKGKIAIGFGGNPKDKSAVRGGPAFELLFNIHYLLNKNKLRNNFEITLFAPMDEPGARMGKSSLKLMGKMLAASKINTKYGKKITEFVSDGVIFEDGCKIESDLTMFISAATGHSVLKNSDLPLSEAGFVLIDDTGLVHGSSTIYAIGDAASLEGPDWMAKQGHIAELMGRNAAHNIIETEKGSLKRKGYKKHVNILCVMDTGNGAAFVFRDNEKAFVLPMPFFGHWMKRGWGFYSKITKTSLFPRLPGL